MLIDLVRMSYGSRFVCLSADLRYSDLGRDYRLNWQPSTRWSKKLGLVSSSMLVMRVAGVDSRPDGDDGIAVRGWASPAFASLRVPLGFAKETGDHKGRPYRVTTRGAPMVV